MTDALESSHTLRASWLITYGDMVTLLLTFFILLFVMMKEAENNIYRVINQILAVTEKRITDYVQTNDLMDQITVSRETKGIHLTISSGVLFSTGEAELMPQLIPLLDNIGKAVKEAQSETEQKGTVFNRFINAVEKKGLKFDFEIRVEGHTDNMPINTPQYPSNWELSSYRALNVVKYLIASSGIPEQNFSALGYGEFRPLFNNDSYAHRAANRRVEIYIDADIKKVDTRFSL